MFEDIYPDKKHSCWTCIHARPNFFNLICDKKHKSIAWTSTCKDYEGKDTEKNV
jgi:hypothetical protein